MKKIIVVIALFFVIGVYSYSFAVGEPFDCQKYRDEGAEEYLSNFKPKNGKFKLLTNKIYIPALEHLKAYCAVYKPTVTSNKQSYQRGASSPLIFDQIIDVGYRYFDALEEESYIGLDPKGKQWRKELEDAYVEKEQNHGILIMDKFYEYWYGGEKQYNGDCEDDTIGLACKYKLLCMESAEFVTNGLNDYHKGYLESIKTNSDTYCDKLVLKRIKTELFLIRKLGAEKTLQLFSNHINSYITEFIKDDLMGSGEEGLYGMFTQLRGLLRVDFKIAGSGVRQCANGL